MLKNVDNIDFQIACILIISGILICVIAILIIKIVANYIWMTGRIVYKRYLFPIISCLGISVFYKDIAQYIKIPSSFEVWIYVCVAIGIIEIFDLVKKDQMEESFIMQVKEMCALLYSANTNILFPNFQSSIHPYNHYIHNQCNITFHLVE